MSELQLCAFLALLVIIYFIVRMALDEIEEEVDELTKKQKKLYMMVQDCNQRYEELKARVNYLEKETMNDQGISPRQA